MEQDKRDDLQAMLFGYQLIAASIEAKMEQIRQTLGIQPKAIRSRRLLANATPAPKKKRKISAAGRRAIAAAQKARWVKIKKAKKEV